MKNTEDKIQQVFLNLLENEDIENISVLRICKELNIKRQTFYYHYQSIYDLVISIFYETKIDIDKKLNFEKNIEVLEGFLSKNSVLCKSICDSFAENILSEFINAYIVKLLKHYFKEGKYKHLSIAFYSRAIASLILDDYKNDSFSTRKLINDLKHIMLELKYVIDD